MGASFAASRSSEGQAHRRVSENRSVEAKVPGGPAYYYLHNRLGHTADMTTSSGFVRDYLERVVNRRDISALDELVSVDYRGGGHGWPGDVTALRTFYRWQAQVRPDWSISVQDSIEVGGCVVLRAFAGGTIADEEQGRPLAAPTQRAVEWLAMYRVEDERILEIQVLEVRERSMR